ncbi:MAG: patatin-like phospholipase family protein [Actinomycetota bacterium]|nr:patatin-like phospholipase family protein [Actinomycetota bacterium]
MNEPYHVLALDGGGLRGIFTAAVLAEAEDAFGPAFLDRFDLLVGTSTGGIIALGLASGRTCAEMLDFFRSAGTTIFSRPRRVRRLVGPKYDRRPLDELLRRELGETTRMNDLTTPVCITAHELVRGTTRVWKDDHAPELRWGGDQLVWKVAAATSAAPTYFAPVQLGDADSHVDGGVWGNNPAIVGITEAVRYGGRDLADIRLLSIGTTSQVLRVDSHQAALGMGLKHWAVKALDLLQGSTSVATHQQARLLLGDERYLRLDSENARKIKLDDDAQCKPLQEWGHDVGRTNIVAIGQLLELDRSEKP